MGSETPPDGVPWEQCRPLHNSEAPEFGRKKPYTFRKYDRRSWMEAYMRYIQGTFDPEMVKELRAGKVEWLCDRLYRERVPLFGVADGRFTLVIDKLTWMDFYNKPLWPFCHTDGNGGSLGDSHDYREWLRRKSGNIAHDLLAGAGLPYVERIDIDDFVERMLAQDDPTPPAPSSPVDKL